MMLMMMLKDDDVDAGIVLLMVWMTTMSLMIQSQST